MSNDLGGTIEEVANIGYNYVEVFGYGDQQYFGLPVSEFVNIIKANNLTIKSGHYLTGRAGNESQGTLTNGWDQAIEDAKAAGQEYMAVAWLHPDERQTLDQYKELTDLINTAGEKVKAAGMQLCYHNHDFEFQELEGEIPMDVILQNTDAANLKVELDLYWITRAGFDPVEFFKKYEGRVPLWHVKDMDNSEEKKFTEVGNGVIDFASIFAAAETAGMEYFFVEQDVSPNPLGSIATSYEYLNDKLLAKG
jgi:sugar phosphate isomerase/epimerase